MVDLIIMMTVLSYEGRCLKEIVDTRTTLDERGKHCQPRVTVTSCFVYSYQGLRVDRSLVY